MSEQTSTHGPRQDEYLQHEVAGTGRVEELRQAEPGLTDDERSRSAGVPEDRRGTPAGMTQEDVDRRSEIAQALGPQAFPGDRESLLATAADNAADDRVIDLISRLPGDETFDNVQDVARALGLHLETRRN